MSVLEDLGTEALPYALSLNRDQNRVDQHQALLQQLQRQGHNLLLFTAVS